MVTLRPEPEHEASVQEESPEPGEGAGRLPQGVGELCGDVGVRRNRWDVLLETQDNDIIINKNDYYSLLCLIHSVTDSF